MTKSAVASKQDSFEKNQLSEEWTVIEKMGCEKNDLTNEKIQCKSMNGDEEIFNETNRSKLNNFQELQGSKEESENEQDKDLEKSDEQDDEKSKTESHDKSIMFKNRKKRFSKYVINLINIFEDMIWGLFIMSLGVFIGYKFRRGDLQDDKNALNSYEKIKSFNEKIDQFYEIVEHLVDFNSTWFNIYDYVDGFSEIIKHFRNFTTSLEDYSNKLRT